MNSFNLFRLDEAREARSPRYISETEFQFIYDCIKGKYSNITSVKDKNNLEEKILEYLGTETVFSDEKSNYGTCEAAKNHFKTLKADKENPGREKLVNVQLFCSDKIPKFMNVYIQKIFSNIASAENINDSLREKFISAHLDVFIDFFKSRENAGTVSITPEDLLNQELVEMYSTKYNAKASNLISFEFDGNGNYIFDIFERYLGENHKKQPKSKAYIYKDCTKLNTNVKQLLCALTHGRKTKEAFKFERGLEHSNQFVPYKGNISYQITTRNDLNGALYIQRLDDANSENKIIETVYDAYAKTILSILASKDVKEVYKNCDKNNSKFKCLNDNIKKQIEVIFTNSTSLKIKEHDKMAKGDVKVDNPVSSCREEQSVVLNKGDILELKYFKLSDITSVKKKNKLHITRILEPDIPKIYKIIKESGLYNDYLNDNGSDVKFFKKFLEEIIDVIIEATKEIVAKDFEQIERTFDKVNGLIIAGPQYIKRENWKILIESGKTGQQGRGVAIVVQLPEDVTARDLEYSEVSNLFCIGN